MASRFLPRRARIGAVVAVAAAAGVIAWLALSDSADHAPPLKGQSQPVFASASGLRTLAAAVADPIYWLGPMPGMRYELTRTSSGRVFIRYLPEGVELGSRRPYLTVATYAVPGAFSTTRKAAAQKGAVRIRLKGTGVAFYNKAQPQNVYFAAEGSDYQVEVFDPSPRHARRLVSAGRVSAVASREGSRISVVSAKGLRAVAATVGHPFYWLGEKPGYGYELTRVSSGRIYVRYLPHGVAAGASRPYLTIATYPFPDALAAVRKIARRPGATRIDLGRGGLAIVDNQYPKSVHLAFPHEDYQVEVFDPSPGRARRIVASGQVRPVR